MPVGALRLRARLDAGPSWLGAVSFSPDGKRLAAGSDDSVVRIWDVTTEKRLAEFPSCRNAVFTADGGRLATGGTDHSLRLWNIADQSLIRRLGMHRGKIRSLALSNHGKWLASGSDDGSSIVCEVDTGRELWRLDPGGGCAARYLLAGRSPSAATYADNTVRLWSMETGDSVRHFSDKRAGCRPWPLPSTARPWPPGIGDHPDLVAARTKKIATLHGHHGLVNSLVYLADGEHLVSVGSDKTVRVWDVQAGRETFRGEAGGRMWSVAATANGRLIATAGEENAVLLWELSP